MDTILGILPDESYNGISELADLSMCVNLYQHTPYFSIQEIGTWYWIATAETHQVMLPSGGVNMCVLFFSWPWFFSTRFLLGKVFNEACNSPVNGYPRGSVMKY